MNGNKPLFLEGVELDKTYYQNPDPYSFVPASDVNLLELSRYAKRTGKKLAELTAEEVGRFRTQ